MRRLQDYAAPVSINLQCLMADAIGAAASSTGARWWIRRGSAIPDYNVYSRPGPRIAACCIYSRQFVAGSRRFDQLGVAVDGSERRAQLVAHIANYCR